MKKLIISMTIMFIVLIYITSTASLEENIVSAVSRIPQDKWFMATIIDFYNNQMLIFFWMIYKEKNPITILILFILCVFLGSFTSIGYIIYQIYQHRNLEKVISFTKRKTL